MFHLIHVQNKKQEFIPSFQNFQKANLSELNMIYMYRIQNLLSYSIPSLKVETYSWLYVRQNSNMLFIWMQIQILKIIHNGSISAASAVRKGPLSKYK